MAAVEAQGVAELLEGATVAVLIVIAEVQLSTLAQAVVAEEQMVQWVAMAAQEL